MTTMMILTDYATLYSGSVVFAFATSLMVLAALMFTDTPRGQKLIRAYLARRLAATRMFSMLEHRQLAPLAYIEKTGIRDLRKQLSACRHCSKQDACDEALRYVGRRHRNLSFCPNRRAIDSLVAH